MFDNGTCRSDAKAHGLLPTSRRHHWTPNTRPKTRTGLGFAFGSDLFRNNWTFFAFYMIACFRPFPLLTRQSALSLHHSSHSIDLFRGSSTAHSNIASLDANARCLSSIPCYMSDPILRDIYINCTLLFSTSTSSFPCTSQHVHVPL